MPNTFRPSDQSIRNCSICGCGLYAVRNVDARDRDGNGLYICYRCANTRRQDLYFVANTNPTPTHIETCAFCGTLSNADALVDMYPTQRLNNGTPTSRACPDCIRAGRDADYFRDCIRCGQVHFRGASLRALNDRQRAIYACSACYRDSAWRALHVCAGCDNYTDNPADLQTATTQLFTSTPPRYCEHCRIQQARAQYENLIQNYTYRPTLYFYGRRTNPSEKLFIGFENEIETRAGASDCEDCGEDDCNGCPHQGAREQCDTVDLIKIIKDDFTKFLYLKHDGSLNNGFEIVSHPATLGAHLGRYNIGKTFDKLVQAGARSHDTKTCGLHFHLSRGAFGDMEEVRRENIGKLIYLYDRFYPDIVKYARREMDRAQQWANRSRNINPNQFIVDQIRYKNTPAQIARNYFQESARDGTRYKAVNTQNRNTIEIRIMRGTLKPATFYADMLFSTKSAQYAINKNIMEIAELPDFKTLISELNTPEITSQARERRLI